MNIDLDAIEKAARHATAPPWREAKPAHDGFNVYGAIVADDTEEDMDPESRAAYGGYCVGESMRKRDREYLLAVQPDVVLELCRRARAAGYQAVAGEPNDDVLCDLAEIEIKTGISRATLKRDARLGRLPGAVKLSRRYVAPVPRMDSPYVREWQTQPRSRARSLASSLSFGARIARLEADVNKLKTDEPRKVQ